MSVSLYAHGPARIEVGKYGMTLDEAHKAFLDKCMNLGLKPEVKIKKKSIGFDFGTKVDEKLYKLLQAVAYIADLHGDPPFYYSLHDEGEVKPGEYVKTGWYND